MVEYVIDWWKAQQKYILIEIQLYCEKVQEDLLTKFSGGRLFGE